MDEAGLRRATRREFIRTHHPDRGGDPDEFIAGMAALGAEPGSAARNGPRVTAVTDRRWPFGLLDGLRTRMRRRRPPPRVR